MGLIEHKAELALVVTRTEDFSLNMIDKSNIIFVSRFIIKELIQTEQAYVADLECCIEVCKMIYINN